MTQVAIANSVQWVGNTHNWPTNSHITSEDHLWINTETYPIGAAAEVEVVYSINGDAWRDTPLSKNGRSGNNDRWHVDLGVLPGSASIQYAIKAAGANVLWDNNGSQDYHASVNLAAGEIGSSGLNWNGYRSSISVVDRPSTARSYVLTTNQPGRKGARRTSATGGSYTFREQPGQPVIRTGHDLFDGLFALAYEEMRQMSVDELSDPAYNNRQPIRCPENGVGGCFQTGQLWTYAWTRDSAYAIDLALAQLDPLRAMNTLLFKTSTRRQGTTGADTLEIIQDTGSGGSWPVSTDRVVWARGAWELLKYLSGDARETFMARAYTAITNTVRNDRLAAYDARDGLYRGETSFLDWREQTYPSWTAREVVHIGMSKTLSTNVNHWKILDVASQMASELGKPTEANRFRDWADRLKSAINAQLWLGGAGLYSLGKLTELDPSAIERFELLGQALAILDGIADGPRATSILSHFPHTAGGAPVAWPQIREVPVYHNAAIWPFVSAYFIKAAALGKNAAVVNANVVAMLRGAALNLSHMENYQFIQLDTKPPVVDSEAQLWSIAGHMNVVLDVVFGRQTSQQAIRFQPFITKLMRNRLFATTDSLELSRLPYKNVLLNVTVKLPPPDNAEAGYYRVHRVTVNGSVRSAEDAIQVSELGAVNRFVVELADANAPGGELVLIEDNGDWQRFWAPFEPTLDPSHGITLADGRLTVHFSANGESAALFDVYRNGQLVAGQVSATSWTDPEYANAAAQTPSFTVAQRYHGVFAVPNVSHRSKPLYYGQPTSILAGDPRIATNDGCKPTIDHGRSSYSDWGKPDQNMDIAFTPGKSGTYLFQLLYGNAFNSVDQGITNCVKLVELFDANNQLLTQGVVMMPHRPNWDDWGESSAISVTLTAGQAYRLHLSDHYNMSYMASNAAYNGVGGKDGPLNRANIAGVNLRQV